MWFSASLFYRGVHTPANGKGTLWLESIRLIEAVSAEEAEKQARRIAKEEEHSYAVPDGNVRWEFASVERVYEIDQVKIISGIEVFSRFLRASEAESILTPLDD